MTFWWEWKKRALEAERTREVLRAENILEVQALQEGMKNAIAELDARNAKIAQLAQQIRRMSER